MTLIAGFRAHGIPILLGDFLITANRVPVGAKKKLRRLRPNCAIAWTDSHLAAERVLSHLDQQLPGVGVTFPLFCECLQAFDVAVLGELGVTIVGWVIDERPHCFRWKSAYPSETFETEPAYDGTGDKAIAAMAGPGNIHDSASPDAVSLDRAIDSSLRIATQLISDESFGRENRDCGFGFGYEILYFGPDGFEYVDDVLYVVVTVQVNEAETIGPPAFVGSIHKYVTLDELSILEVVDSGTGRHALNLITAVGDAEASRRERDFKSSFVNRPLPAESRFYCLFVVFASDDYVGPPFTILQGPEVPAERRVITGTNAGEISLSLSKELADWAYATIRRNQQAN